MMQIVIVVVAWMDPLMLHLMYIYAQPFDLNWSTTRVLQKTLYYINYVKIPTIDCVSIASIAFRVFIYKRIIIVRILCYIKIMIYLHHWLHQHDFLTLLHVDTNHQLIE
jgi:hypothetical protein